MREETLRGWDGIRWISSPSSLYNMKIFLLVLYWKLLLIKDWNLDPQWDTRTFSDMTSGGCLEYWVKFAFHINNAGGDSLTEVSKEFRACNVLFPLFNSAHQHQNILVCVLYVHGSTFSEETSSIHPLTPKSAWSPEDLTRTFAFSLWTYQLSSAVSPIQWRWMKLCIQVILEHVPHKVLVYPHFSQ